MPCSTEQPRVRQGDPVFLGLLNELRLGHCSAASCKLLRAQVPRPEVAANSPGGSRLEIVRLATLHGGGGRRMRPGVLARVMMPRTA